MKFVDELYEFYKNKLIADDEDIDLIVYSIMQELSRDDMLQILGELSDNELYQITGRYIALKLHEKIMNDQNLDTVSDNKNTYFH